MYFPAMFDDTGGYPTPNSAQAPAPVSPKIPDLDKWRVHPPGEDPAPHEAHELVVCGDFFAVPQLYIFVTK